MPNLKSQVIELLEHSIAEQRHIIDMCYVSSVGDATVPIELIQKIEDQIADLQRQLDYWKSYES